MANKVSIKDIFSVATEEGQHLYDRFVEISSEGDNFFERFVNKVKTYVNMFKDVANTLDERVRDMKYEGTEGYMTGEEMRDELVSFALNSESVDKAYDLLPYNMSYSMNIEHFPLKDLKDRATAEERDQFFDYICDRDIDALPVVDNIRAYALLYRDFNAIEGLSDQERETGIGILRAQCLANIIPDGKQVTAEMLEQLAKPLEEYAVNGDMTLDNNVENWYNVYKDNDYAKMIDNIPEEQPVLTNEEMTARRMKVLQDLDMPTFPSELKGVTTIISSGDFAFGD